MTTTKPLTPEECVEQLRRQILDAYGASTPGLESRLNELDNAYVDVMGAYLKSRLRAIGEFLDDYGAGAVWHDLFLRFGLDVTDSSEAWALGDRYRPGDEWRFVHPDNEAAVRAAIERARE